jgi:hypothetical protein
MLGRRRQLSRSRLLRVTDERRADHERTHLDHDRRVD